MKSWIHEIAESYVAAHKPVRRDLKENYVSLNEEQRFNLLSENVLNYLDEQLKVAYGFGVGDLTEEELGFVLGNLFEVMSREEAAAKGTPTGPGTNYPDPGEKPLNVKKMKRVDFKGNPVHRALGQVLRLSSDKPAKETEPETPRA